MGKAATLSWTSTTSFRINGGAETFYENDAVLAGTHPLLDDQGRQNFVMSIARLRDCKIYRYDHMRTLSGTYMADRHVKDRQQHPASDDRPF